MKETQENLKGGKSPDFEYNDVLADLLKQGGENTPKNLRVQKNGRNGVMTFQERNKQTELDVQNHKANQPHNQTHAGSNPEPTSPPRSCELVQPGINTADQILTCRILIEKHLQRQKDVFHNAIDFEKTLNRVWHEEPWHVMQTFSIEEDHSRYQRVVKKNSTG